FVATHARDKAPHYQHSNIGYNYRLSNICAGIGRGQMEVLPDRVAQRRKVFEFYKAAFSKINEIQLAEEPDSDYFCNRWLTTMFESEEHTSELQSRENLVCRLLLEKKK